MSHLSRLSTHRQEPENVLFCVFLCFDISAMFGICNPFAVSLFWYIVNLVCFENSVKYQQLFFSVIL